MAGPDANNGEAPYPVWGFGPPSPEPDTKKLDALLASLNGSAARFQAWWLWFVSATVYLAFLVLGSTHRKLLLDQPIDLTGLAKASPVPISAPLGFLSSNFSIVMAIAYVNLHIFIFLLFMPMAKTAIVFEDELRTVFLSCVDQDGFRARIENAFFLQVLVGGKREQSTILLGIISFVTIVILPVLTLILMQMVFLPFHSFSLTWWLRGVVIADVVLALTMTWSFFFPRAVRMVPSVLGSLGRKPRWAVAMTVVVLLAIVFAPLVDWLSFKQGRWAGEPRPSSLKEWAQWMAGQPPKLPEMNPDYAATEDGVIFDLFPDRLLLRGETIVGDDLFEKTKKEIVSRGGFFVPTLRFDGRDLQAADLSGADLRGVSLNGATLRGANLAEARLDGARLGHAQLEGTNLSNAQLQGADLFSSRLQGANLFSVKLLGAYLVNVELPSVLLSGAELQGADVRGAQLQGANLVGAKLQGADLSDAELQGADLSGAQSQGADLSGAQLQGADLSGAQLQGADLSRAQLQGANLSGADLSDCVFDETFVFHANVTTAYFPETTIKAVNSDRVFRKQGEIQPLTQSDIDAWIAAAAQYAAEDEKAAIVNRFRSLDASTRDSPSSLAWRGLEEASQALDPDGVNHRKQLARILGDIACGTDGAPYVARSLIAVRSSGTTLKPPRLTALGDQLDVVRERMQDGHKNPESCPGTAGFNQQNWDGLRAVRYSTEGYD